jgi:gliding motility-associated-like protein
MTFVDTGLYYIFPYGSKPAKLSKPVLVSGTTYEWSLSDSLSVLKNGLERVSDTLKSRFQVQFLLETNCQITAGAFVSILPDGKIGCGEPVRKIGYTGSPIRIKGVDNPYITLITLSPDSVNMCTPSVTLKSKMIILGPTKTLNNDSLILSLPAGFTPDTANFSSSRIPGKGKIRSINGEIQWSWLIPKNMPPGDSILMDLKLFVTNKPGSCGTEPFLMQSVTKKKAFCVKTNDSCDINVATGSFYKSFKADKAEPVIRLLRSVSVIAGDSGEIVDVAFSVSNNKKAIDTALKTNFYLVVDKNANNKFDKSDVVVQKFVKANGWPTKQTNTFAFKGFVKNTDICRLIIFSDSSNCQCLKNVLPLINIRLQNAGRDTSFCSNYSVILGRDSIKGYKYEWIPPDFLSNPKGAKPVFKKPNFTANNQTFTYFLKTTRLGGCTSTDTVIIITKPSIYLPKLKDTIGICFGSSINIGDTAKGGKGFLTFKWNPSTNLTPTNKMVVKANPKSTTKYVLTISDQNNCSIKDSSTLLVARAPSVKIGVVGNCEKKAIRFIDESNYNGLAKGTTMWRIDFNNVAQIDPPYIFDTIGFYFVRLIVSNSLGCTDSNYRFVTVNGNPAVYNTKANACIGDSVLLTDNSTVAKMKVKSVVWAFGTDTVKAKSAKKAFTKSGVTYFTQTVVSDSGCVTQLVDSLVVLAPPKIGIGFTGKCVVDTINIKSSVKLSNNDSVQKYTWTVKNQNFNTANTRFKFDSAGTYTIALKAISKAGCKDSFSRKLVINPMPVVKFSIGNYCNYDTLKTVNSSSISKGKITKYQWLRDNVKAVTSNNYVFGPLKEGLYAVKLIAISDSSCSDSTEQLTTVHPAIKPAMVFNIPCVGDSVKFSDVSNLGNAKVGTRTWTFASQSFTDSSFKILAATQGKFTVKYKVITDKGCTYSLDSTYTVVPKPVASFTSSSVCKDNTVIFSDLSLPGINSKIASRKWFHAGNFIKTDSSFIRVFANAGNEPMSLVVVNAFGCKDSTSQIITVEPKNYTNFSVNDACPGDSVTAKYLGFTGNNAVSSHKLTWGDGYTSSSFPHTHSYSSTGTYVLKLTTTTLPGCDYDTIHNVKIHPVPKADFDFFPLFPDVKYPNITLTDKSLGAVTWNYSVDDSLFSVLQNPKYSFPDSGSYFIKLKVSNSFGCVDSTQKMVYVNFILLTHIPNAFSPGNDDINPLFKPEGLGIKDYRMTIYNRWGEKIYDADWGKQPWDGTYKGEFVQIGSYPYYMEVIDFGNIRHSYQGLIQVIR